MLPTAMEVMEDEELELCVVVYIPPDGLEREVNLTFDLVPISTFAGNQPYFKSCADSFKLVNNFCRRDGSSTC